MKLPKLDHRERSQPDSTDLLEIQLFGGIGLRFLDRDVPLTNRKAKALIGLLALCAKHSETREAIVGQLWSDTEEHKARASLRQVAHQLREAFDAVTFRGFSTGRTEVVLDPATINVDVAQVCASTKVGRPHALLLERMRLSETLMTGYEDTDPAFRAWLLVQRESLRQKLIRDLELRLSKDVEGRLIGEALLRLDPTHEGACQEVMRSYADAGDIAGALRSYKGLWDLLEQDYDMEPAERTQELVAAIKSGSYRPRPGQDRSTSQSVHSTLAPDARSERALLARAPAPSGVLPGRGWHPNMVLVVGQFDGEAVRPEQRHIAAGFRYDLMTRLVRFREWSLVDSAAVDAVQTRSPRPHYRLSARFFPINEALLVIMSLEACDTGVIIWSDRYTLGMHNFFDAQQEIIKQVAMALNVHLPVERLNQVASAPDVSLEIYDRWLRGQALMTLFQPADHQRATRIFESITIEAPNFGPAYSGLAQLENSHHIVFAGTFRTIERQQRALSLATTAVRLDPLDSRAQLCLGWANALNDRHEGAEPAFRLAAQLNENDQWTVTSAAWGLACCGHTLEAIRLADEVLESVPVLSPIHWSYQCQIRFITGDYEASLRAGEQAGHVIRYTPAWRAAALQNLRRSEEALKERMRFFEAARSVWQGESEPTDAAILRWFATCFPIRDRTALERLRRGIESAGVHARG